MINKNQYPIESDIDQDIRIRRRAVLKGLGAGIATVLGVGIVGGIGLVNREPSEKKPLKMSSERNLAGFERGKQYLNEGQRFAYNGISEDGKTFSLSHKVGSSERTSYPLNAEEIVFAGQRFEVHYVNEKKFGFRYLGLAEDAKPVNPEIEEVFQEHDTDKDSVLVLDRKGFEKVYKDIKEQE